MADVLSLLRGSTGEDVLRHGPHMIAYARIIMCTRLVFSIQGAATDWASADPGLYTWQVTYQAHRASVCQVCSNSKLELGILFQHMCDGNVLVPLRLRICH